MTDTPPQGLQNIGRLAFREEGEFWNAYYAIPETMLDAVHIGSIKLNAASRGHAKQMFMDTMREVVADIIEKNTGQRPQWKEPIAGPEHERTRKA